MSDIKRIDHGNGIIEEHGEDSIQWFLNKKLHREDGPAIENIGQISVWFINGQRLSEPEIEILKLNAELKKELSLNEVKTKKIKI